MWSNRVGILVRGARGGTLINYNLLPWFSNQSLNADFLLISALPRLQSRLYSSDSVPKITTHYTVVPRETDPRWKGNFCYSCYVF